MPDWHLYGWNKGKAGAMWFSTWKNGILNRVERFVTYTSISLIDTGVVQITFWDIHLKELLKDD